MNHATRCTGYFKFQTSKTVFLGKIDCFVISTNFLLENKTKFSRKNVVSAKELNRLLRIYVTLQFLVVHSLVRCQLK